MQADAIARHLCLGAMKHLEVVSPGECTRSMKPAPLSQLSSRLSELSSIPGVLAKWACVLASNVPSRTVLALLPLFLNPRLLDGK